MAPLTSVQKNAIATLATGNSIPCAAELADVSRATIYNWLKLPEFQTALVASRREFAILLQAKMGEITDLAIDTIRQILTDPKAPPSVKLRAALAVLDRPMFPKPDAPAADEAEQSDTARNAPCPCGSGNKYKRCCGTTAPPKLSQAA